MNQQMLAIITDLKQMKKFKSLNKEIEDIKRIEVKILEMKTTVTKIKKLSEWAQEKKETGKRISEIEDRTKETMQPE